MPNNINRNNMLTDEEHDLTRHQFMFDKLMLFLVTLYILLYEWLIFEWSAISPLVNLLKLTIPFVLFAIVILDKGVIPKSRAFLIYVVLFILFLLWSLIPTIIADTAYEGILQWVKFLPRFVFFIAMSIIVFNDVKFIFKLATILVVIGLIPLLQYILLLIYADEGYLHLDGTRAYLAGPYGLLGNITAKLYVPGFSSFIPRLSGFWIEPSNAAGYLFAIFFLSRALLNYYQNRMIKIAGLLCLLAAFLSFSNAGYFCFGGALLAYVLLFNYRNKFSLVNILLFALAGLFIMVALFGRGYLVNHNIDSVYLRTMTGVQHINFNDVVTKLNYDPYFGRLELAFKNIELMVEKPFGIGFRIPGQGDQGEGFEYTSASAIFYWLAFTGIPGITILLLMLAVLFAALFQMEQIIGINIAQAWIAIMLQNIVYGTWFTPFYLCMVAFTFAAIYHLNATNEARQR